jgi:hypothetical protein
VYTRQWRHVIVKPRGCVGLDHSGDMHMDVPDSIDAIWSYQEGVGGRTMVEKRSCVHQTVETCHCQTKRVCGGRTIAGTCTWMYQTV